MAADVGGAEEDEEEHGTHGRANTRAPFFVVVLAGLWNLCTRPIHVTQPCEFISLPGARARQSGR
eukprot:36169-Prymnesium_polylepis.1